MKKRPAPKVNPTEQGIERRGSVRLPPSAVTSLKSLRLIGGPDVHLVNISRGGVLVETDTQLMPGIGIAIRLITREDVHLIRGRVLRSRATVFRGTVLMYQSSIAFDEQSRFIAPESVAVTENSLPEGTFYEQNTATGTSTPTEAGDQETLITINIPVPQWDENLLRQFELNEW